MPIFPLRNAPTKKADILLRRRVALGRAVAAGERVEKLQQLAEAVRTAELGLLKARLALLRYRKGLDPDTHPGAQIERDIEAWSRKSPDEILAMHTADRQATNE